MITKNNFNPQCITFSQMNLIFNARIYYRRLATWTRAYIISRFMGIGIAEDQFERLYLESLDIGNMLQIIFGREYSKQYGQLVSQFAITYRDLLSAQLEGDTEGINQIVGLLYKNIEERAALLAALNPYWSEDEYKNLFETLLQYVFEDTNSIIAEDYSKDIETYELITTYTTRLGDFFSQGLYDYITSGSQNAVTLQPQGDQQCITYEQMNVVYDIRMFWFELVTWVRNYMLSRYTGIGNANEVFARLKQVPIDYTNTLKQVFGEEIAVDLLQELNTYLELMNAFITAHMEGNTEELNRITQLLYQNADERAASIASVNPFWDETEWRNRLHNNLRMTIEESTTFLAGDYARNIDIFTRLIDLAESTSTYFAQGLFDYINDNQQNL